MNVASPGETMLVALQLVAGNGPLRPREFAKLLWPRALRLRARCSEHGRKESAGESTKPNEAWVTLYATPRHESVICAQCQTTPPETPGPGWARCGTNPQSWQHLCPACAAKGA